MIVSVSGVMRGKLINGMYTYIISTECKTYLKIGKSTEVNKRLSSLQTGSALELMIEGWFNGNIEDQLHEEYKQYKKRNEWFQYQILESLSKKEGYIKAPIMKRIGRHKYKLDDSYKEWTKENSTGCIIMYMDKKGNDIQTTAVVHKKVKAGDKVKMIDINYTLERFVMQMTGYPSDKYDQDELIIVKVLPRSMHTHLNDGGCEWENRPEEKLGEEIKNKKKK